MRVRMRTAATLRLTRPPKSWWEICVRCLAEADRHMESLQLRTVIEDDILLRYLFVPSSLHISTPHYALGSCLNYVHFVLVLHVTTHVAAKWRKSGARCAWPSVAAYRHRALTRLQLKAFSSYHDHRVIYPPQHSHLCSKSLAERCYG